MKVVVTGGAGYIGSVVTAQLVRAGHQVTVLDNLSSGHADAVLPGATLVRTDVAEAGAVLTAIAPQAVLHFAARSLVGESVGDPAGYWRANVAATIELLDATRAAAVPRFVFSSTAAIYGSRAPVPILETSPADPANPYGSSKLAMDLMLGDYARAYGIAAVSLRYFNVAGALHLPGGPSLGERHRTETHLIPLALRAADGTGAHLELFGTDYDTPDGTGVRDYVHVIDLAEAHIRALECAHPGEHQVLNLGSGTGYSVRQVLDTVAEVTGRKVPILEAARRPGDAPVLVASIEQARAVLGWQPQLGLSQMISDAWRFHTGR